MNTDAGRVPDGTGLSSATEPCGLAPAGFDPSRVMFHEPTPEELHATCSRNWAVSGPFNIDQWPDSVAKLSMPTKFIEVSDFDEWWRIFDGDQDAMLKYAGLIDAAIGFEHHFIRMNSRSPKDSAYPGLPITCAGKQAISWISTSERCADDTSLHQHARKPFFICAREYRPIRSAWEFRCFAKDGVVVAVSRYDYHNSNQVDADIGPAIMEAAHGFYARHLSDHYGDVVFDLHAPGTPSELLIELNPYGLSDPCCFGSYAEVEKGGVRFTRDSDGSGEAGETGTGLTEGYSADPQGIAQGPVS